VYFVPVDELVGGAILGATSLFLPGYSTAQRVLVPATGATVNVYARGTMTVVDCFEDQHGAGTAVAQPLTTNIDGQVVDAGGNRVYVGQPQEVDIVVSGGGLAAPKTIPAGNSGEGAITKSEVLATGLAAADIGADPAGAAAAAAGQAIAMALVLGG
jgi:hypothetical protein